MVKGFAARAVVQPNKFRVASSPLVSFYNDRTVTKKMHSSKLEKLECRPTGILCSMELGRLKKDDTAKCKTMFA